MTKGKGYSIDSLRGGRGFDVHEPLIYISVLSDATPARLKRKLASKTSFTNVIADSDALSDRIISIKVTSSIKRAGKAEITLWNEDLALNDHPVIQKGTIIQLLWGYSDYMGKPRKYKVHKIKGTTARVRSFGQVKIICLDNTFDLHGKALCVTYTNATLHEVVRHIAKKYGITGNRLFLGPEEKNPKRQEYFQSNKTDAQFLKELAQKVGWIFRVENKIMTFAPTEKVDGGGKPIALYTYFTDEEGWIKRFEPQTDVMGKPGSITVRSRDPITGKKVRKSATIREIDKRLIGKACDVRAGVPNSNSPRQMVEQSIFKRSDTIGKTGVPPSTKVVNSPGLNAKQASDEAKLRMRNSLNSGIKSRMLTVGDPDLWAGSLIVVENVGKMLNGLHRLISVTHHIDQRGYECESVVRREALGTLGGNKKPGEDQKVKSSLANRKISPPVDCCSVINLDPKVYGLTEKLVFRRR